MAKSGRPTPHLTTFWDIATIDEIVAKQSLQASAARLSKYNRCRKGTSALLSEAESRHSSALGQDRLSLSETSEQLVRQSIYNSRQRTRSSDTHVRTARACPLLREIRSAFPFDEGPNLTRRSIS